jgi:DNA-binding LacI/PurR family transcriptional regulator
MAELGARALNGLADAIGAEATDRASTEMLATELVVRDSCRAALSGKV